MTINFKSAEPKANETKKRVGFLVDKIPYCIDIMCVREVINPKEIMAVPALPDYVKGVADHRSEVVPIIDVRARFGLDAVTPTPKTKWIIVLMDDIEVGLEVDLVTEVFSVLPENRRDRLPEAYVEKPWIKQVYQMSKTFVFELDMASVVNPAKLKMGGEI